MQNESQRHNDKGRAKTSLEKHVPLTLLKGFEKGYCERELETKQNYNILTPTLTVVSVVSFSFSRAAQLEAQRPTLLAFSTTSYQQPLWTPTHQGPQGPHQPSVVFPTTTCL